MSATVWVSGYITQVPSHLLSLTGYYVHGLAPTTLASGDIDLLTRSTITTRVSYCPIPSATDKPLVISFTYALFITVAIMPDPRHPRKRPAAAPVAAAGRSKRQKGSKSQPKIVCRFVNGYRSGSSFSYIYRAPSRRGLRRCKVE
jgi:hypothetical protein